MNEIKREKLSESINFTYIPESKFKSTLISFSMFTPLLEKDVSKNALIAPLLAHSCKKYPTLKDITLKLEDLYGACIVPSLSKLGESQVISVSAMGLNNLFAHENSNNTTELTTLLCEMIFNPNIENESFKEEEIAQEKRQLIDEVLAELNDKRIYAKRKCEENMCSEEKFGISVRGDIESIEKLNGKDIFLAWQNLLKSSQIEITVVGSANYNFIMSEFKKYFSQITRENIVTLNTEVIKKAENIKEIKEEMDVSQCKLVMGMRTEVAHPDEDVSALILMNALFGGGAQSKLFLNVREKLSLCYYCSSSYNKHKGLIFVESGVEQDKIEETKKEIMHQLKEIKIGNFTDSEFSETKLFLSQRFKSVADSLSSLNSWYVSQILLEKIKDPSELIEEINNVSREKVIEVANKITLDTVYILSGKEKKEEN